MEIIPFPRVAFGTPFAKPFSGDGDIPTIFEGYPLNLDLKSEKTLKNYTIFGNTSEDAKGVGDWDGEKFVAPIRVASGGGETLYPSVLSSPLHKIGDIVDYKESNGKEWHGLGVVDLGSLNWTKYEVTQGTLFRSNRLDNLYTPKTTSEVYPCFCPIYTASSANTRREGTISMQISGQYGFDIIDSNYTDAASFKAAMQGVMLVYELATPTEVQGEPLPRLAIPKGESIVTLDTAVEPSNITAKV